MNSPLFKEFKGSIAEVKMPRGGPRPNSGPKKKKVEVPIEALSRSTEKTRPTDSEASPLPSEDELWAKVTALALQGNPVALKLALEQRERDAKVALLNEQTRNLKLRNVTLQNELLRKGLIDEDSEEFEPMEDPVQNVRPLKAVGE